MRDVEHYGTEAERSAIDAEVEGLPEEEGVDLADADERLDEEPDEAANREQVPENPEESVAAGSEPAGDED